MTARVFADTNIAVYMLGADPVKRRAAVAIMRANPVISVQVVNEFLSVAVNKIKLDRPMANRLAQILMRRCEVQEMNIGTVQHAIDLGERYQLSHWDALIVSSALQAGCVTLCSEDMQHGQVFEGRVQVSNPFVVA